MDRLTERLLPLLPALFALGLLLTTPPFLSADGMEQAMAGRCMWWSLQQEGACAGLEPWFWPPAFPFLVGGLTGILPPATALLVVSLGLAGLLVLPLALLARRAGGPGAGLVLLPLLLAIEPLRRHLLMGDARTLAMLALATAWLLALDLPGARPRLRALAVGLLGGLAILSRPEALLLVGVLGLYLLWRQRRLVPVVALGILALALPYWAALSLEAGGLTLTGRSWQGGAYGWLATLHEDWVKLDLSAGSRGSPLRSRLIGADVSGGAPPTADPAEALRWGAFMLRRSVPVWLAPLAAWGAWSLRRGPGREVLLATALLALPSFPIALLPQAQDEALPTTNLQLFLCALAVLAAAGLGRLADRGRTASARAAILSGGAGLCLALGLLLPLKQEGRDAQDPTLAQAASWLQAHTDEHEAVAVSLSASPAVHLAERRRVHLPSPWAVASWLDDPGRPDWLLYSHLDRPFASGTLRELVRQERVRQVAVIRDGHHWLAIYEVRDR